MTSGASNATAHRFPSPHGSLLSPRRQLLGIFICALGAAFPERELSVSCPPIELSSVALAFRQIGGGGGSGSCGGGGEDGHKNNKKGGRRKRKGEEGGRRHEATAKRARGTTETTGDHGEGGERRSGEGGMRASGRAITSSPPPNTLQSPVPTHSHSPGG